MNRRQFIALSALGLGASLSAQLKAAQPPFRIRTITAGFALRGAEDLKELDAATAFLERAKARFEPSYVVQTTRIATTPLAEFMPGWQSSAAIERIIALDQRAQAAGTPLSVGPVLAGDDSVDGFGAWAGRVIRATQNVSFSVFAASERFGLHHRTIRAAAEAIATLARETPGGAGNFRFCATAHCPPGSPFFPAAYHQGPRAFSIGLESPNLLAAAVDDSASVEAARRAMTAQLNTALAPIEALAKDLAAETDWRYLGIDSSPAPGLDASIGAVIEKISGAPFGAPATLAACAAITSALQDLDVKTCGYSGLMLPVLEDRVLAQRASEGRYGVSNLLLYSSVCGTGLDVVPLPGDTTERTLAAIIEDVAALSLRYRKALSARLFVVPGKQVGDEVSFDNPYLTASRVLAPES